MKMVTKRDGKTETKNLTIDEAAKMLKEDPKLLGKIEERMKSARKRDRNTERSKSSPER